MWFYSTNQKSRIISMADAEFIVVCIDSSSQACFRNNFEPQLDAIKHYCKAKLDANPETEVVLFTMGSEEFGFLHNGTSDYQEILDSLPRIYAPGGRLSFKSAINWARSGFSSCPPNKQKRMFFLAGGLVDVDDMDAVKYGMKLKGLGIAVDVVNFYLGEKLKNTTIANQFGTMELDAFVHAAKSNDNSHIEHVEPGSSIRRVLSKSILRETLRLSRKSYKKESKSKRYKKKRYSLEEDRSSYSDASESDSDEDTKLNRKRKRKEKKRKEESKSKKSRREYSNDDDDGCDKVVEKGHKKDKGRSSKNRESDIKHVMSAYDLSAKLMKLYMEGKPEEALKLLKETKVSDEADDDKWPKT